MYFGVSKIGVLTEVIRIPCHNCKEKGVVKIQTQSEYIHLMFIPFVPSGKKVVSKCTNCKQILYYPQMNDSYKIEADYLLKKTKTPLLSYVGIMSTIILISIFTVFTIFSTKAELKEEKDYIINPQKMDCYYYRLRSEEYNFFLVDSVTKDSVYLLKYNEVFGRNNKLDWSQVYKNYFNKNRIVFGRDYLFELHEKRIIIDIFRAHNE